MKGLDSEDRNRTMRRLSVLVKSCFRPDVKTFQLVFKQMVTGGIELVYPVQETVAVLNGAAIRCVAIYGIDCF